MSQDKINAWHMGITITPESKWTRLRNAIEDSLKFNDMLSISIYTAIGGAAVAAFAFGVWWGHLHP